MKDNILLYSQLSPAEQADIESYVEEHPDLYPLLEEAKALGDVFQQAQRVHADLPDDEVLAYYLLTRQMSQHPTPPSLQTLFSRIEARMQTDEVLRARYDRLAQRLVELEAASDTIAHFERVTGHRVTSTQEYRVSLAAQPDQILLRGEMLHPEVDIQIRAGGDVTVWGDPEKVYKDQLFGGRIYFRN